MSAPSLHTVLLVLLGLILSLLVVLMGMASVLLVLL